MTELTNEYIDSLIDKAKKNSYGAFIFPENKQQILDEMYEYLKH